jgi:hypothetical protein
MDLTKFSMSYVKGLQQVLDLSHYIIFILEMTFKLVQNKEAHFLQMQHLQKVHILTLK